MEQTDNYWIRIAIDLAKESKTPFGAVIVDPSGQFVGAYNTTIHHGATAHAEINALQKIHELDYNLAEDLTLYTTVEPCPMCMSGIIWAGVGRIVFGATMEYAKEFGNQIHIKAIDIAAASWYAPEITGGIEEEKCQALFK